MVCMWIRIQMEFSESMNLGSRFTTRLGIGMRRPSWFSVKQIDPPVDRKTCVATHESESAPDPLTSGFPFRHDGRKREGGHDGNAISQVHGRARRRGLENGTDRAKPARGSVHHSDHGSQYVSLLPSKTMRENGVRPSMGSISSPWDNAAMESLMGIVRTFLPAVVTPPSERKSAAGA